MCRLHYPVSSFCCQGSTLGSTEILDHHKTVLQAFRVSLLGSPTCGYYLECLYSVTTFMIGFFRPFSLHFMEIELSTLSLSTDLFLSVSSEHLRIIISVFCKPPFTQVPEPGQRWYLAVLETCDVGDQTLYGHQHVPGVYNMIPRHSAWP